MYVLAWRDGVSGYRFILIGIGIAAFFDGLVGYVLTRAQLFEARQAMHWLTGSVGQASADRAATCSPAALAVLLPLAVLLQRQLRALELGDDTARALGTRTELSRAALLGAAVVLVALAVAGGRPDRRSSRWSPARSPTGCSARPPAASSPPRWSARRCCSPPTSSPSTCCRRRCRPAWSPARSARRTCCGCWPPPTGKEPADDADCAPRG